MIILLKTENETVIFSNIHSEPEMVEAGNNIEYENHSRVDRLNNR